MNADVLIWGPIGNMYVLGKKGQPQIRQQRWRDLPDAELEDAINWVIEEQQSGDYMYAHRRSPKVFIYSNTYYAPLGHTVRVGKNVASGGTMFHYMIVSDEKIESEEQALVLVNEAIAPKGEGQQNGDTSSESA